MQEPKEPRDETIEELNLKDIEELDELSEEEDDEEEGEAKPKPKQQAEHYFTETPRSEKRYGLVTAVINGMQYEFLTCSGVFSPKGIDKGTFILAENMRLKPNGDVLDFGCGYGTIGTVAAGLTSGKVLMTDINKRAIELAKKNIKRNRLENAKARQGNIFEKIPEKFDAILLNPPFTAGMDIVFAMLEQSKEHLNPDGTIQVVARHNKGGSRLKAKLLELYGNCEETAREAGYRVYLSIFK
jgi:16S rRNA (guanine1207-N2)-methyltransferase